MTTIINPPKIKTFMLNNQKIQIINDPLKQQKIHTNNLQIKSVNDSSQNLNYNSKKFAPQKSNHYSDLTVSNGNQSSNSFYNVSGNSTRPSTQMRSKRESSNSQNYYNGQSDYHKRAQSANKQYFNKTHNNFTHNSYTMAKQTNENPYGYNNLYDVNSNSVSDQINRKMGFSTFSQKKQSFNNRLQNSQKYRPSTGLAGSRQLVNSQNNYFNQQNGINMQQSNNNLHFKSQRDNGLEISSSFQQKKYTKLNQQIHQNLSSICSIEDSKLDTSFKIKNSSIKAKINDNEEQSNTIKLMKNKLHHEMLKSSQIKPLRKNLNNINNNNSNSNNNSNKLKSSNLNSDVFNPQPKKRAIYKCFVQGTNNCQLVKKVIQKKQGWGLVGNQDGICNLQWFDSGSKIRFDAIFMQNQQQKERKKKQIVNHFQGYRELASKPLLLKNFEQICISYGIQMFDFMPQSFIIDGNSQGYQNDFEDFLNIFFSKTVNEKQDLINIEILRRKNFYKQEQQLTKNKNNFLENRENSHINKLKGAAQLRNHDSMNAGYNMWIFKPSDNNRGIGIRIFSTIQELILILQEYYGVNPAQDEDDESTDSNSNSSYRNFKNNNNMANCSRPFTAQAGNMRRSFAQSNNGKIIPQKQNLKQQLQSNQFVIQKYIEKPLLVNERKFDLRLWVLIGPDMQLYVFKEGYLRLSSEKYVISNNYGNNNKNQVMHLTNNAVQKNSKSYGKYEEGNQMNYDQFEDYLEKNKINMNFKKKLLPKMKEMIALSYSSVKENKLNPNNYDNCFEIFGYDFFIDADHQAWLIEANTNPCLEESSQILKDFLPRMINDAFSICLDKNFPCNFQQKDYYMDPTKKHFSVEGYDDAENLWEPISVKIFNHIKLNKTQK